jgi:hypothetical protein
MDTAFSIDNVPIQRRSLAQRRYDTIVRRADGMEVRVLFHLPTGDEQETLASESDDDAASRKLLEACVEGIESPEGSAGLTLLDDQARRQVEVAIEDMAPSVEMGLDLTCPECGHAFAVDLDVSQVVLRELCLSARQLYRDVHTLASQYHWSEEEILALPRPQRKAYLAMISEDLSGGKGA